jgi:hypothetical protein
LSQISSIKKDSSSKKHAGRNNVEYSKSALSSSPQKPKLAVKKFDLNFEKKQERQRERPSTKIKPRGPAARQPAQKALELHKQQISEIPGPQQSDSNMNLNQLIDNLDEKFQLFSDHNKSPDLEQNIIPKKAERIKDLKNRKLQNDQIYESS